MRKDIDKQLTEALRNHFKQELGKEFDKVERAASAANWDIYFGPGYHRLSEKKYFLSLDRVRDFVEERLSETYIDLDCDCVFFNEPEGYEDEETGEWIEPYTENTYKLSRKEVSKLLFGECSGYL